MSSSPAPPSPVISTMNRVDLLGPVTGDDVMVSVFNRLFVRLRESVCLGVCACVGGRHCFTVNEWSDEEIKELLWSPQRKPIKN